MIPHTPLPKTIPQELPGIMFPIVPPIALVTLSPGEGQGPTESALESPYFDGSSSRGVSRCEDHKPDNLLTFPMGNPHN